MPAVLGHVRPFYMANRSSGPKLRVEAPIAHVDGARTPRDECRARYPHIGGVSTVGG